MSSHRSIYDKNSKGVYEILLDLTLYNDGSIHN